MTETNMELNELSLWEAPEGTAPPAFGVEPGRVMAASLRLASRG